MRYLLLIHSTESRYETMAEEELGQLMAAYGKFTTDLQAAGAFKASDRLQRKRSSIRSSRSSRSTFYSVTS